MKLLPGNKTQYDDAVLVGYYGGLNYGDELLLECLQLALKKERVVNISVLYHNIPTYNDFHDDYGNKIVERTPINTLRAFATKKNIIVGGGGHWGMDANKNVLLMSLLILAFKLIGKRTTLLGVGFYDSTGRLGRLAGLLAALGATHIYARDNETYSNFRKYNKKTILWKDIAELIPRLEIKGPSSIVTHLPVRKVITLRRFNDENIQSNYEQTLKDFVSGTNEYVHLFMMEALSVDPDGYKFARNLESQYKNLSVVEYDYNAIELVKLLKSNKANLRICGLQYHMLMTGFMAGVHKIWNIAYDKKCEQILSKNGINPIHISELTVENFAMKRQNS